MVQSNKVRNFLIFWFALIPWIAAAQPSPQPAVPEPADTSRLSPPDTLAVPTVTDTTKAADTTRTASTVDTTIGYSANSIEFLVGRRVMRLKGDAMVTYKNMNLRAAEITVNWDSSIVVAEGLPDTLWTDSARTNIDTVVVSGEPVFVEGDQQIRGETMTYNLKTRKGRVSEGSTAFLDGFYRGEALKKVSTDVLYGGEASYTTCDLPKPHYSFHSKKMKLIVGDRVIAEPVILYFNDVPVMAIPFGVFPSRHGRQSGLIIPTYGENTTQGRFLYHLGYYWAANEFSDFQGTVNYYEKSGFLFNGLARYNWRYHLSGTVSGAISRRTGPQASRAWELHVNHDQTIDPDTRLTVHGDFVSSPSYYAQYGTNLNQQLQQILRSDATLNHTFPGGKNSITANVHHEQDLTRSSVTEDIPRITFRRGQSAFFPVAKPVPGDTTKIPTRWYNNIYYNYTGEGLQRRLASHPYDSLSLPLVSRRQSAARHGVGLNSPQTVSYFTITPALNLTEVWVDQYINHAPGTLAPDTLSGFRARHTFGTSMGFTTKVYGYWLAPLPGIDAIRHVATPTLSLNFTPDFSDRQWGYYQYVQDSLGVTHRYDRFAGSLYGNTPAGKTFGLNFQLSNLFQMKYGPGEEKDKKKVDLFTLDLGTGYNFAADSLGFSNLTSSFRSTPISGGGFGPLKSLSLNLSSSHSFYKYGPYGAINQYYFDPREGKFLRLLNFDVSVDAGLSIGTLVHPASVMRPETDSLYTAGIGAFPPPDTTGLGVTPKQSEPNRPQEKPISQWYLGQIPFDFKLSFHYTVNRYNPNNVTKTYWVTPSVSTSITPNWQVSYSTYVDLVRHQVTTGTLSIYRDMHCWEASFNWSPVGIGQGYYLRINIKSPQLQDVKVERRRNAGGFIGFQ